MRELLFLVPKYYVVGTSVHYLLLPNSLLRVYYHYSVRSSIYSTVLGSLNAGRIVALHAKNRHISDFYARIRSTFFLHQVYPELSMLRLRCRIGGIIVIPVFIFTGGETAIASGAS